MSTVGAEIAVRDVWFGRTWRAFAARVVASTPELVALWSPKGSPSLYPVDADGREVRLPNEQPVLARRSAPRDTIALQRPGARHSIWLFWNPDGSFQHWYVNFERTIGWNGACFDTVDEKLDLIVTPDGALRWKDEDELEHAAELGLLDLPRCGPRPNVSSRPGRSRRAGRTYGPTPVGASLGCRRTV